MCSVLLYVRRTWAVTQEYVTHLYHNDIMMITWICSTKLTDKIPSEEKKSWLGRCSIENVLRCGRLHWHGHLQCMDSDTWPRKVNKSIVIGSNPRGWPRKTWLECIRNDLKDKGLEISLASNRTVWRWTPNVRVYMDVTIK